MSDDPGIVLPQKGAINPDVLFTETGKKVKAFINPDQLFVFSATEALQEYHRDPDIDVMLLLLDELRENSRAVGGVATQKYCQVAEKRIEVEDRKRVFQKEEQTM